MNSCLLWIAGRFQSVKFYLVHIVHFDNISYGEREGIELLFDGDASVLPRTLEFSSYSNHPCR